jgi:uncharacterized protein YndB with AHSA1/START domain
MDASDSIHYEMTIEADPASVFAFFTDPKRLVRWMGASANLDPRRGGLLLIDVHDGAVARGKFTEVVPVSRLAYTWGWEGNLENVQPGAHVPPGSSLVEIDLAPKNGGTLLRFKHSGLPPEAVPGHRDGWNHYLARLALAASGHDPGPDPRRKH